MIGISRAWNVPLRRIYLVWGSVLITGFILTALGFQDGWVHWYPLAVVGLLSQIIRMRLKDIRAKILLGMWAIISLGGTFINQQLMLGELEFPSFFTSFALWWLGVMAIPQMVTGFLLKSKFQIILGIIWGILAFVLRFSGLNESQLTYLTAAVTGLPYLYIAFRK